ncbi:MAG TPA: hypothetical protein VMR86_01430 [Myxococcota bacterium]|nr:hypothetical protein [Myxococcota bacterium]
MVRASVSCVVWLLLTSLCQAEGLSGTYQGSGTCRGANGVMAQPSTLVVSETGPGAFRAELGGVAYTGRVDASGSGFLKRRGALDPGYGNGHGALLDLRLAPGGALSVSGEFPGAGTCTGTWTRVAE